MSKTKPANQKRRINILQGATILVVPLIVFSRPGLPVSELSLELIENIGILLIICGVLGRLWSILYIGGHKNMTVMRDGPYSICRHPLYLFSTIAILGFGLLLGSLILGIGASIFTYYVLKKTAQKEENFLISEFGQAYTEYMATTPAILPKVSLFSSSANVTFNTKILFRNFIDCLVFLALIPFGEIINHLKELHAWPTFPLF